MNDPVSCLLCLDAFERPTMLRINLRPIPGGDPHEYYFCQRCGGAIAAEYLYIQNSGKADSAVRDDSRPTIETRENGNAQVPTSGLVLDSAAVGAPAPAPGEAETVAANTESAESPRRSKKEGRKESL